MTPAPAGETRVRVGGFASRTQALLAQGYLADQGIGSSVVTDDAGGAAPFVAMGAHGIALLVRAEEAAQARALLAGLSDTDGPTDTPPRPWFTLLGRVLLAVIVVGIVVGLVAQATGR